MVPIRIGILGLSPGAWAANAHLPYLQSPESKFKIVAVCNSSVDSSKKAIEELKLGEGTKAYGNPQDLADDKDVDLVVCAVRVDRHYSTIVPALKAGKDLFVEWPLGKNLQEAQEMLKLAKEHNVKLTAVGLQGRFDSGVETLKAVLAEGRIGKVLSSTITASGGNWGASTLDKIRYLTDRDIGGTMLTIPVSHNLDCVREVLGEFASFQSLLSVQRPRIKIVNSSGAVVEEDAKQTAHDQVMIQGTLKSGAVFSAAFRGGTPFKGAPGLEWRIYGEKGEIRILGASAHVQIFSVTSIEIHDAETDKVETIEFVKGGFDEMPPTARNLAREYEAIAVGGGGVLCDFEGAVRRHELVEEMTKQNPGS